MAERYRTEPAVRHGHFVASMVWGVGLLAEALMRVVLVFLLPISVVVGLSTALVHATSPKNAGRAARPAGAPTS